MMKINCYANYGELGHEKLPVYATVKGEVSESITLVVPDGVTVSENEAGQKLVEMPGSKYVYLLSEVLTNDKTVRAERNGTMKKVIYVSEDILSSGDSFVNCISFDAKETEDKTMIAINHLTASERAGRKVLINAYEIDCEDGESAEDAYNRHLDEVPWLEDPISSKEI